MIEEVLNANKMVIHQFKKMDRPEISISDLEVNQLAVAVDGSLRGHLLLGFLQSGYYVDLTDGSYATYSTQGNCTKIKRLDPGSAVTLVVK